MAKPNRTDLNTATQPIQVPTGMAYGKAGELEASQQGAPLPQAAEPDPRLGVLAAGLATPPPSPMAGFAAPTMRPMEPVTAGLDIGAGPGSEMLAPTKPRISEIYQRLADETGDVALAAMADEAAQLGY